MSVPGDYVVAREQLQRLLAAFWPERDQVAYASDAVAATASVDAAIEELERMRTHAQILTVLAATLRDDVEPNDSDLADWEEP